MGTSESAEQQAAPWTQKGHPEHAALEKAAMALHDQLHAGPLHEGFLVGVGSTEDNLRPRIFIMLYEGTHQAIVPETFEGYEVKALVTGRPEALKAD